MNTTTQTTSELAPSTVRTDKKIALGVYVAAIVVLWTAFFSVPNLPSWLSLGLGIGLLLSLLVMLVLFLYSIGNVFRLVYQHAPLFCRRTGITALLLLTTLPQFLYVGKMVLIVIAGAILTGGMSY